MYSDDQMPTMGFKQNSYTHCGIEVGKAIAISDNDCNKFLKTLTHGNIWKCWPDPWPCRPHALSMYRVFESRKGEVACFSLPLRRGRTRNLALPWLLWRDRIYWPFASAAGGGLQPVREGERDRESNLKILSPISSAANGSECAPPSLPGHCSFADGLWASALHRGVHCKRTSCVMEAAFS